MFRKESKIRFAFQKATIVLALVAFFSCKDELVNNPYADNLNGLSNKLDTFTVIGNTVLDTAGYKLQKLPIVALGVLQDAVFGTTEAGCFTNFELPTNELNPGNNLTLDSLVLSLVTGSSYGPVKGPVNLQVFEVNTLIENKNYDFSNTLAYTPIAVGELKNFVPNYSDSVPVLGIQTAPHFRIRISDVIGNALLAQTASTGFKDNGSFQSFYKGLYIKSDGANTGLHYLNMTDPMSKLTLFYKADGVSKTIEFKIGNNANYIGRFTHQYPSALKVPTNNPLGEDKLYLEGLGGLKAKIQLPTITNLSNMAIARAELVVTVDDYTYTLPNKLYINQIDTAEKTSDIQDYFLPSYNGKLQSNQINGKNVYQYRINMTRYIQRIINKEVANNPIFIYANQSSVVNNNLLFSDFLYRGSRLVIGGNNPNTKLKLEILYLK